MKVDVWDQDPTTDDLVGSATVDISKFLKPGKQFQCNLYFDNRKYQPDFQKESCWKATSCNKMLRSQSRIQ